MNVYNLMSTMQETLKASAGIDVKELLENLSGKGNVCQSVDGIREELKQTKE